MTRPVWVKQPAGRGPAEAWSGVPPGCQLSCTAGPGPVSRSARARLRARARAGARPACGRAQSRVEAH
eukprot:748232-Hanusia_phi.AAC.1